MRPDLIHMELYMSDIVPNTPPETQNSQSEMDEAIGTLTEATVASSSRPRKVKSAIYCSAAILFLAAGAWWSTQSNFLTDVSSPESAVEQTSLDVVKVSDAAPILAQYDRNNYDSIEAQVHDLQRSIPSIDNLMPFNGARLSEDESNEIRATVKRFDKRGYKTSFLMMNLQTGKAIAYDTGSLYYSASAIKAPYLASVLSIDDSKDLKAGGALDSTCKSILLWSDNDSYLDISIAYGNEPFQDWCHKAQVEHTLENGNIYLDINTADLAKMWLQMYSDYSSGLYNDIIVE